MGTSNYSDEFKRDAVHQITVRGYPVREVSRRLGVSTHSLYKWVKLFGEPSPQPGVDLEAENRRLKRELARVTEQRDILKRLRCTSREGPNEVRLYPAIVATEQWERVQAILTEQSAIRRGQGNSGRPIASLAGKLFDVSGERLTPVHTLSARRRHSGLNMTSHTTSH